jgi:flagellar motor switch protein FliN/FliY
MSDQVMSQDELDALLAGEGMSDAVSAPDAPGDGTGDAPPSDDLAGWGLTADDLSGKGGKPAPKADKVNFEALRPLAAGNAPRDLEFILDIPLQLTVEVGRTAIEIGELLQLGPGSIVELDKLAGEPLEVYANDKLVARGEAVIVNEKFGIRLTDIVSKSERIETLH